MRGRGSVGSRESCQYLAVRWRRWPVCAGRRAHIPGWQVFCCYVLQSSYFTSLSDAWNAARAAAGRFIYERPEVYMCGGVLRMSIEKKSSAAAEVAACVCVLRLVARYVQLIQLWFYSQSCRQLTQQLIGTEPEHALCMMSLNIVDNIAPPPVFSDPQLRRRNSYGNTSRLTYYLRGEVFRSVVFVCW